MMFNPWVLLGLVLFYLASLAGAGYAGWDYRDAKVAQQVREATDDALSKARQQAADDMAAATRRAAEDAAAKERARRARNAATQDAIRNARADCARSVESVSVLNAAIDAANGAESAPGKLPDGVRGLTPTGGRLGLERKAVGDGTD